jgi:hypothetical protein
MYKISEEDTNRCELVGLYGPPGQPPKWVIGCLGLIFISILIPAVGIFILSLTDGLQFLHLIHLGVALFIISLRWLIQWPKLPEKIIFDPISRQVHFLDSLHQSIESSPSMSYGEINSIKVQKKVERSNKRSVTRFYTILTKSDTSNWSLLGPYSRKEEATQGLDRILSLSQWSLDQGTELGQVNSTRDESAQSFTSGWALPQRVNVDRLFKIESLSEHTRISWYIHQPKGRVFATKLAFIAFLMITLGATNLTELSWIVSPISAIITLLIGRGIRRFNPEQEIEIYRDQIVLSSTAGIRGDKAKLNYESLNGIALDLDKEGMKLRFVTMSDLNTLKNVDGNLEGTNIKDVFKIYRVLMNATYINTSYMSAGDILRLEEIIQEQVRTISSHQLS